MSVFRPHGVILHLTLVTTLGCAIAACSSTGDPGDSSDAATDAPAWERTCWSGPGEPSSDVEVMMGFGLGDFQPLVDEQVLDLHYGAQPGMHVELNARMRGFFPGDLEDGLGPAPHTYFSLHRLDGEALTVVPCITPLPYMDIGDGWYELPSGRVVIIGEEYRNQVDGERVIVRMQVQDPEGRYAQLEQFVELREPVEAPDISAP